MNRMCRDRGLEIIPNPRSTSGWVSSGLRQSAVDSMATFTPPRSKPQQFSRREMIPLQSHQIWRIDSGCARTITGNEEGEVITLGFWRSGEFVSQSLFDLNPYQIECLTGVEASLLLIESWDYQQVLMSHVQQSQAQQAQELLIILRSKHMESRLLNFLKWLTQQFGQATTQGWWIDLRLTHQDIADAIGTTRVTITRLLKQLEKAGVIRWSKHRQILLSSEMLFKVG